MRARGANLVRRSLARLMATLSDDGARCHRCGVCHNVCALMGRKPGWFSRSGAGSGAADGVAAGHPHPIDAKAQED